MLHWGSGLQKLATLLKGFRTVCRRLVSKYSPALKIVGKNWFPSKNVSIISDPDTPQHPACLTVQVLSACWGATNRRPLSISGHCGSLSGAAQKVKRSKCCREILRECKTVCQIFMCAYLRKQKWKFLLITVSLYFVWPQSGEQLSANLVVCLKPDRICTSCFCLSFHLDVVPPECASACWGHWKTVFMKLIITNVFRRKRMPSSDTNCCWFIVILMKVLFLIVSLLLLLLHENTVNFQLDFLPYRVTLLSPKLKTCVNICSTHNGGENIHDRQHTLQRRSHIPPHWAKQEQQAALLFALLHDVQISITILAFWVNNLCVSSVLHRALQVYTLHGYIKLELSSWQDLVLV